MTTWWTQFSDMHSGGDLKVNDWSYIYIQAERELAVKVFKERFGRDPHNVTCTCCGQDYSINVRYGLDQVTGHSRNCRALKTPKRMDGRYRNGMCIIQKNYYLEKDEEPPKGFNVKREPYGNYQSLDEYIGRDDVHVVWRENIDDDLLLDSSL